MRGKYSKNFIAAAVFLICSSLTDSVLSNYYSQGSVYYPAQNGYYYPQSRNTEGNYGNQDQQTYWSPRIVRRSQPDSSDFGTTQPQKPRRTHYGQTASMNSDANGDSQRPSGWNNRWSPSNPRSTNYGTRHLQRDSNNRVQMGVANSMCDDAKTNLTVDWNLSPVNHTCYHPETRFPQNRTLPSLLHCDRLPPRYVPGHVCMNKGIRYSEPIPTHGDHRPLWPMFGEYVFVPRERWLHNIEHGAVVMLFHPCAHPSEVAKLKRLVKSCVGKHIITPSNLVPPERPLALVAWGCRLLMASVDEAAAKNFFRMRALKGPEGTYTKEGQFTYGLLKHAKETGNGAKFGYSRIECV